MFKRVCFATSGAFLLFSAFAASPQVTPDHAMVLPTVVIVDSSVPTPKVLGQGNASPSVITILMKEGPRRFPVRVWRNRLETPEEVYYTTTDCTGTEYLLAPSDELLKSFWEGLAGANYALGPDGLYRVLEGETVLTNFLTQSQFRSNREIDQCRTVNTTADFIQATQVTADILLGFTPPFKVQE